MSANEFFERKNAEYEAAVSAQNAERRAEAQTERAKVKKEADAIYTALVDAFPAPPETPAEDTRPLRDAVAEHFQMTPGQRERLRVERHHARKAAQEAAAQKQQRAQNDGELPNYQAADIDLDSPEYDEEEYYDGDEG